MARLAFDSVVFVHGKDSSPSMSWYPWVQADMTAHGLGCTIPKFPPEDDSKLAVWFKILNGLDVDFARTAFVGHARGAMALLRWINTLPPETHIPAVVIVSPNFDYQPTRMDGDEFYAHPLNVADLRQKCPQFVVIHSADDPYVPIAAGEQLAKILQAKFVRYETAGHFGADKLEAPEIMKELLR